MGDQLFFHIHDGEGKVVGFVEKRYQMADKQPVYGEKLLLYIRFRQVQVIPGGQVKTGGFSDAMHQFCLLA